LAASATENKHSRNRENEKPNKERREELLAPRKIFACLAVQAHADGVVG
jgi:hypothetical protein